MTAFDFFNILRSIPKTLRFNFHYFPLGKALKLPVVVSHRTYLRELHGKVELPEKVETAMVKIGFGDVGHYDRKRSRTIWQVSGVVSFGGKASIGHGSKLSVRGHLDLGTGFNITAESTIVCAKEIRFGDDCLLSWDILVMDTDEHPIYRHETTRHETRDVGSVPCPEVPSPASNKGNETAKRETRDHGTMTGDYDNDHFDQELKFQPFCESGHSHGQWSWSKSPEVPSPASNNNERINPDKAILVGDHVWIGCKCILLKGAEVPSDTVLAAGTLLKSAFAGENQVIGGNPPSILKRDVRWEH